MLKVSKQHNLRVQINSLRCYKPLSTGNSTFISCAFISSTCANTPFAPTIRKKKGRTGVATSNLRRAKRPPTAGETSSHFGCFTSPCSWHTMQVIHICACHSHTDDCLMSPQRTPYHHSSVTPLATSDASVSSLSLEE